MNFLTERLARGTSSPLPVSRDLLAHLHSGDVLRCSLPKVLRITMATWLFFFFLAWLAIWPAIYEQFERWGLVKAFFAQMLSLATAFLVTRITMLRAGHLEVLPTDDFVVLRAVAVLCRWLGEIALVYIVGMRLSALLQPVNALLSQALENVSPAASAQMSSETSSLLLVATPVSFFFVAAAAALFLSFYSVAITIDVLLAIEFNTRAERMLGKKAS